VRLSSVRGFLAWLHAGIASGAPTIAAGDLARLSEVIGAIVSTVPRKDSLARRCAVRAVVGAAPVTNRAVAVLAFPRGSIVDVKFQRDLERGAPVLDCCVIQHHEISRAIVSISS